METSNNTRLFELIDQYTSLTVSHGVIENMLDQTVQAVAAEDAVLGVRFRQLMQDDFLPRLTARMRLINALYFTESELEQLIAFYTSEVDKKTVMMHPAVMAELQIYAQSIFPELEVKIDQLIEAREAEKDAELEKSLHSNPIVNLLRSMQESQKAGRL